MICLLHKKKKQDAVQLLIAELDTLMFDPKDAATFVVKKNCYTVSLHALFNGFYIRLAVFEIKLCAPSQNVNQYEKHFK